jgi:hypothetical protein
MAYVKGYSDIFETGEQQQNKIYVLGDVGTGKSTFCKMMIENWCDAVTRAPERIESNKEQKETKCNVVKGWRDGVRHMGQYEFLFFIPLQYMSAFKSDDTIDMIKELTNHLTSNTDLIDKIFQKDSRSCLIIADSLDEWTPPKDFVRKPHVSYGIPNGDRLNDATVITLSRPSAKGILNLKNSEFDIKLQLLGISEESLMLFIERYCSKLNSPENSNKFFEILESKQIEHMTKTPLFLQQLLFLYCNGYELGNSVSETYCHILNTMLGWSDHKTEEQNNDERHTVKPNTFISLPTMVHKFQD